MYVVCTGGTPCVTVCVPLADVWKSEESWFSPSTVGFGDRTQAVRVVQQVPLSVGLSVNFLVAILNSRFCLLWFVLFGLPIFSAF